MKKSKISAKSVIDLNFDVSEKATKPGENLVKGLKDSTTTLGKIFAKDKEAKQLIADFDKSIEKQNLLITEKIKL